MNSPTTTQSQALRLFIDQKTPPEIIDKLFQSLLNLRRHGTWTKTYNNAQGLTALAEYSQLQPTPPNFAATVKLAGKQLKGLKQKLRVKRSRMGFRYSFHVKRS